MSGHRGGSGQRSQLTARSEGAKCTEAVRSDVRQQYDV